MLSPSPRPAAAPGYRQIICVAVLTLFTGVFTGCASFATLPTEVATFGRWPEGRSPGAYVFDRLPSQSERGDAQALLEAAAAPALEQAGFRIANGVVQADVRVEVQMRLLRVDLPPWPHPGWFGMGWGIGAAGPGDAWLFGLGLHGGAPRYEREVLVLIREMGSGQVLYEARAASEGATPGDAGIFRAMFQAALSDFPATRSAPRKVSTPLQR